jgi:chloramphenicol 3-O phosphotransferase
VVDIARATRLFHEHHPELTLRSVSVNGDRVDVRAGDAEDEWHIVFGVIDGGVDWMHTYRRPPAFPGVAGGRAVVVNGPSSVGKSTLLAALQAATVEPWVVFDEPHLGAVRPEHLIWREGREVLHRGFVEGIAALARAGNSVAVAAGGLPQSWFDVAFADVPTLRVGLQCPTEELDRREATRRDVRGGLAAASLGVHDGWSYDLEFDTAATSADEMALTVMRAVSG